MNTITGLRPAELSLPGASATAGWPGAAVSGPAQAGSSGAPRWLDGLASADTTVLSADIPPGASGLGAAEHAQRVLAALLGD